jgi:hypothetical protein
MMKTDLEIFYEERVCGVRQVIHLNFPVDSSTPPPVVGMMPQDDDPLLVLVVPTCAEGVLSVEVYGFVDGQKVEGYELVLRDPNRL